MTKSMKRPSTLVLEEEEITPLLAEDPGVVAPTPYSHDHKMTHLNFWGINL